MADSDDIISALTDYLRYKSECGERTIELEPGTLRELNAAVQNARNGVRPASQAVAAVPAAAAPKATDADTPAQPPQPRPAVTAASATSLDEIARRCGECRACVLCEKRQNVVPGQGNAYNPDIMFVGEAPGADEDAQGLAFVGRAGELLTKMIAAMGYTRDEVFIANICKCRPPNNRTPSFEEMAQCLPFLKQQIALIRPKCIVALGNTAMTGLLGISGITRMHGTWKEFSGIPLMPTYHPAYLLRLPAAKRDCWKDLQLVMRKFGKL